MAMVDGYNKKINFTKICFAAALECLEYVFGAVEINFGIMHQNILHRCTPGCL